MSAMRWLWLLFALSFCGAAQAQLLTDQDAREAAARNTKKLETLTGLVRDLNEQNTNLRKQLPALSQQQQQLKQQLRELSGRLEEAEQASKQQRAEVKKQLESPLIRSKIDALTQSVAELADKIANLEQFITLPPEQDLYNSAYEKFQKKQYEEAIADFNRMTNFYPQGQFGANARYWVSRAHLALGDYEHARTEAELLLAQYPNSGRQAEAMLVGAEAMQKMGLEAEARGQLEILLKEFPTSLAADEARRLLAE